jgi:hypothetical protein
MKLNIDRLSDTAALKLLHRYVSGATASVGLDGGAVYSPSPADLRTVLLGLPVAEVVGAEEPSEGDVAREALRLLSQNTETAARLGQLEAAAAPMFVDPATLIMTSALALSVLQVAGYVSYDKKNGWRFRMEKKPASDSVLLAFVNKVLARFGSGT